MTKKTKKIKFPKKKITEFSKPKCTNCGLELQGDNAYDIKNENGKEYKDICADCVIKLTINDEFPRFVCPCCNCVADEEDYYIGDEGTKYEGDKVCFACYREEYPQLVISVLSGEAPPHWKGVNYDKEQGEIFQVGECFNHTQGDFKAKWEGQGYRGEYEPITDGYKQLHEDGILSMSEDAEELKNFDNAIENIANEKGILLLRVVARSSNLFYAPTAYYCLTKNYDELAEAIKPAKDKHRDNYRYTSTALTGKSPSQMDDNDKALVLASASLQGKENISDKEIINIAERSKQTVNLLNAMQKIISS